MHQEPGTKQKRTLNCHRCTGVSGQKTWSSLNLSETSLLAKLCLTAAWRYCTHHSEYPPFPHLHWRYCTTQSKAYLQWRTCSWCSSSLQQDKVQLRKCKLLSTVDPTAAPPCSPTVCPSCHYVSYPPRHPTSKIMYINNTKKNTSCPVYNFPNVPRK